jgi:hypothetical protein
MHQRENVEGAASIRIVADAAGSATNGAVVQIRLGVSHFAQAKRPTEAGSSSQQRRLRSHTGDVPRTRRLLQHGAAVLCTLRHPTGALPADPGQVT